MRRIICLLLSLLIVSFAVPAFALSPKAALCQKNIDLLDDVASLENLDKISSVAIQIYQLKDADAASLDTSKLQNLSKQLLDIPGSPVQVCAELCKLYDNADDMTLFGDVFYAKQTFSDGEKCYYYEFSINDPNADNKPRSMLCIAWPEDGKLDILTSDDEGYFSMNSFITENSNEDMIAMGVSLHMFGGKLIADALGCQHIKLV